MKNIVLLFLLLSSTIYSQKLINVIDKNLSINLPDNFIVSDTLGVRTYNAEINQGNIIITIFSDIRGKINEGELDNFYERHQEGMLQVVQGKLVSHSYLDVNSIKLSKTVMLTEIPNMFELHVYTNRFESTTYSILFVYVKQDVESSIEKQIVESIKMINN